MFINEIFFTLKDSRQAMLRSPREEDVQGLLEYLWKSTEETEFVLRSPEENARYTFEKELAFVKEMDASPDIAMLVCIVDGRVAGNCEIRFNRRIKTRHRASIGIALLKEFWNQGIGTRMFEEMLKFAREREGLLQVELEFIEGNVRARHLYEKMGFRITGMRPDAIRLKDGTLRNEYQMMLKLT